MMSCSHVQNGTGRNGGEGPNCHLRQSERGRADLERDLIVQYGTQLERIHGSGSNDEKYSVSVLV